MFIPGLDRLCEPSPAIRSIYDETGTAVSGYEERGPYHCEDCIHKTAHDEPFCIHPAVIGDPCLQDRLVQIDGRPVVKINMEHGCCKYVNQMSKPEVEAKDEHGE
jgi:hypothetical protein